MTTSVEAALDLLVQRRILALTGAGLSTDSGIPDYRGPDSPPRTPMTFSQFVSGVDAQRRYWARSHLGWQAMQLARPNDGHRALAGLEASGALAGLITQNVDGLHTAAGSGRVVDLHGRIADVTCLGCTQISSRADLHARLHAMNPRFGDGLDVEVAPDGDAALGSVTGFRVAACTGCGGVLKPDVIFFGENVPKDRVARCFAMVDAAEALLVAGSSLTVLSGFRFVRHAHRRGIPVVIVNRGETRGDPLATVKLDAGCSETLTALTREISRDAGTPRRSAPR
ncbi:MAG TPA: NAD-dependent protein deacetylase [Nocardioidaceae bacterium]|nr:NAD-dependent protein deacetylase [Actinomycetota bacterium]HEV8056182.1 NAD-dependent protein deacetylase [Nocardioidaceae bacterium]